MKYILPLLIPFSNAFAAVEVNSFQISIELRERGEWTQCANFYGWSLERAARGNGFECVFKYQGIVNPQTNLRLDYTGVLGYVRNDGEIDLQYYVGDVDSGIRFKFRVPSTEQGFVFGHQPYRFELSGGDYVQNSWQVGGVVMITPVMSLTP